MSILTGKDVFWCWYLLNDKCKIGGYNNFSISDQIAISLVLQCFLWMVTFLSLQLQEICSSLNL